MAESGKVKSAGVDVVVVGSCMRDLTCFTPRLPKSGETIRGHNFVMGFGGKGANQCVAAMRMGAKTALVANLGDDQYGNPYYDRLRKMNINVDRITFADCAHTGIASILVDDNGENSIVILNGANDVITEEEVEDASNLIVHSSVLVCQWEIPMKVNLAALRLARKHGVTTVFNAAPASAEIPAEVFKLSDIFCVNETEAEIIIGSPVSNVDEAKDAVRALLKYDCGTAIVTLGEKGVIFASRNQIDCTFVTANAVKVVDTTGAGDAFVGALAYYLSLKRADLTMSEIIKRSAHFASITVQAKGTQDSFPDRKNLPEELFV